MIQKIKDKSMREIEIRGLLKKGQYLNLIKKLDDLGYTHEKDNKLSYFFKREKGIFKLNNEISKNQARISLKLGDEIKGSLEEYEVIIDRRYFKNLLTIFQKLGFTKFNIVNQIRDNFYLKDLDVELALKYSNSFQYHFEIEYLGKKIKSESKIKEYLKKVCAKLEIIPMEEIEILQKIKEIRKRLGWIK